MRLHHLAEPVFQFSNRDSYFHKVICFVHGRPRIGFNHLVLISDRTCLFRLPVLADQDKAARKIASKETTLSANQTERDEGFAPRNNGMSETNKKPNCVQIRKACCR